MPPPRLSAAAFDDLVSRLHPPSPPATPVAAGSSPAARTAGTPRPSPGPSLQLSPRPLPRERPRRKRAAVAAARPAAAPPGAAGSPARPPRSISTEREGELTAALQALPLFRANSGLQALWRSTLQTDPISRSRSAPPRPRSQFPARAPPRGQQKATKRRPSHSPRCAGGPASPRDARQRSPEKQAQVALTEKLHHSRPAHVRALLCPVRCFVHLLSVSVFGRIDQFPCMFPCAAYRPSGSSRQSHRAP